VVVGAGGMFMNLTNFLFEIHDCMEMFFSMGVEYIGFSGKGGGGWELRGYIWSVGFALSTNQVMITVRSVCFFTTETFVCSHKGNLKKIV